MVYVGMGIIRTYINNKKNYRLAQLLYTLILLKRYDDAVLILLHKGYGNRNIDINNSTKYPVPYINDISAKTLGSYKEKFNKLYYKTAKLVYNSSYTNKNNSCKANWEDHTNINSFVIPRVKENIELIFEHYTELYKQITPQQQNEFLYLFFYKHKRNVLSGLLSIKPKF